LERQFNQLIFFIKQSKIMKSFITSVLIFLGLFSQTFANGAFISLDTPNGICVACSKPTGLVASNQTGTTALLTWTAVAGAVSYNIEVENGSGNPNFFKVVSTVTGTSYTVSGLLPNMAYKFKVRAKCGSDKSKWTEWFSFNSSNGGGGNGDGCNAVPGNRTTTSITTTSAMLNWGTVQGITGYRIRIENASGNPTPFGLTVNLPSGTTNYTVTGLLPGKSYKWKVRTLCGTQTGDWSSNLVFTTPPSFGTGNGSLNFTNDDNSIVHELKAFPNPTSGLLNVSFVGENDEVSFKVVNLLGKTVLATEAASNEQLQLDLSFLPPGIYLLAVQSGSIVKTQKVTIR
jgi:Secretion system C-terminal sorting domain/Fibronectin type III domain